MIENVLIIGVLVLICVLVDGILLLLVKVLPRYNLTEIKTMRWEAGNPPMKFPKYTLPMQYFGYMFLFMAAEPIIVILLLFSAHPSLSFTMLLLLSLLLLLPAIYVGYEITLEMAEARS
ncbi:MAG: NADH-quinone oxidoreductase subunit A [Desulfobacterales bacterium]|nr:NADH-quinone oxidoreductase subunit A [Desulfobacterales bacterium]